MLGPSIRSTILLCCAALGAPLVLTGCAGLMNGAVKHRTIPSLSQSRDLRVACEFGQVGVALSNTVSGSKSHQALTVAWAMAGLCAELDAREQDLQGQLALVRFPVDARAAAATDYSLAASRAHSLAADRFQQAYVQGLLASGDADDCKLRSDDDQGVYLLGLMSGLLAQVNDGQAGGTSGIPLNQILNVARATACLDDARWWGIPSAAAFAAWATVPGSAPQGVDPWAGLEASAGMGDAAGQGIPRALWLFSAANAGKDDLVRQILVDWPAPQQRVDTWPLLDAYARVIARHEADRLWIAQTGHRAPQPPQPPPLVAPASTDPFGADPFGAGPFGAEPFGDEAPIAE